MTDADRIVGFLRLSLPSQPSFVPEIESSALIREVHVYGAAVGIGTRVQRRARSTAGSVSDSWRLPQSAPLRRGASRPGGHLRRRNAWLLPPRRLRRRRALPASTARLAGATRRPRIRSESEDRRSWPQATPGSVHYIALQLFERECVATARSRRRRSSSLPGTRPPGSGSRAGSGPGAGSRA